MAGMAAGGRDREEQVRAERARAVGLFRYGLICDAADPGLGAGARGRLVRELAAREHPGPFGVPVRVSRATIDRWIRDWRRGGFDALVPDRRRGQPRTPAEVLELAAALKREVPGRTAAQVAAVLRAHAGWAPDERTLQRHFARLGLGARPGGSAPRAYGRFEAEAPNLRWTGDALHGPTVRGRKSMLLAFLDDHSRLAAGYRWVRREDAVRLQEALRAGMSSRGVPASVYLDNGAAMVDRQLARACAVLGIRLVHSRPGQPAGRGKIERFFRTVRDQFLVELGSGRDLADLAELNATFAAWVETVYHRRVHSETGQSPIERWAAGWHPAPGPELPEPAALREAFLWSQWRTVTKTATVSLHGNHYEVDPALVGRRVELVYDPYDLTEVRVRWQGRAMGPALPYRIGRHVHHRARPDETTAPPAPTGIDYLRLIEARHADELAGRLRYAGLGDPPATPPPAQARAGTPPETETQDRAETQAETGTGAETQAETRPGAGDAPGPGQLTLPGTDPRQAGEAS